MREEDRALLRTIVATVVLGLGKLAVALFTASQAVLASAVDSLTDGAVSALNLVLLRQARAPADAGHPWGHGKIEALAALAQGLVLAVVVVGLAYNAVSTLIGGEREAPAVGVALAAMGVSMSASFTISTLLARLADKTGSLVLKTDAVHYRMDLFSGAAVVVGLGVAWATGHAWADAAAALLVCGLMAHDVWGVLREAVDELMDRPFPPEEVEEVERVLRQERRLLGWHDLRTRKAGPFRFVQVHVELPGQMTFAAAHDVVDELEHALRAALPQCDVLIHPDPAGVKDRTDAAREDGAP